MNNDPLQYPNTLKYFQFERYIDPNTKRIIRTPSAKPYSFEAKTNYALSGIEKDTGAISYLNNRLREQVSCFVFAGIMGMNLPVLSTIVNDIYFNVDAIGDLVKHRKIHRFAIDFTENYTYVQSKLMRTNADGTIRLQGDYGYIDYIPLVVVTIASELVNHLLSKIETTTANQENIHPGILRSSLTTSIKDFLMVDHAAAACFSIHVQGQGEFQEHIRNTWKNKINQFAKNPPPSW